MSDDISILIGNYFWRSSQDKKTPT